MQRGIRILSQNDPVETPPDLIPIRNLCTSLIGQALDDLLGRIPSDLHTPSIRRDAHRWIYCDEFFPTSFLWCCEVAGLEASEIRRRIPLGGISSFARPRMPERQLRA